MSETLAFEEDKHYVRCGEIFITTIGDMIFYCTLCEDKYEDLQKYCNHLRNEHYPFDEDGYNFETCVEDLCEDDFLANEKELLSEKGSGLEEEKCHGSNNKILNYSYEALNFAKENKIVVEKIAERKLRKKERLHVCNICNFSCTIRSNLISHQKRHSGFKPFQCTESNCTKAFYTKNELKRHINETHKRERLFVCQDCGKAFPSKDKLANHFKRHLNIRDVVCSVCGLDFFDSHTLNNHMRVHSNNRPYRCNIGLCKATFKRRTGLATHIKLHQNKREYQCKLCPASFNQNPGLHAHMKTKHPGENVRKNYEPNGSEYTQIVP